MIDQTPTYDVVVIGSGLGGLVAAVILAKEGKRVCVIEKNNQFGGNLQTFSRDKKIFDTGVHYIGGLAPGQNLYRYFSYLGIMDNLSLEAMPTVFDKVYFKDHDKCYPIAHGYDAFVEHLSEYFPDERQALEQYIHDLKEICAAFPLYNLEHNHAYSPQVMQLSVKDYFLALTKNEMLRGVLIGTNFLYAGREDKTPFYVHGLTVNSYLQSAYRCLRGGSQIAKLLIRELRKYGGEAYKREEVLSMSIDQGRVTSVSTSTQRQIRGDLFISNIDPKRSLELVGEKHFRKTYYTRIQGLEVTTSAFSLHLVLKPGQVSYVDYNLYGHRSIQSVWTASNYSSGDWPAMFMVSMTQDALCPGFADTVTILSYMHFKEVARWSNTRSTVAHPQNRGKEYEDFKAEKTRKLLSEVSSCLPGLQDAIQRSYVSTPLSYRDYIGMHEGNLYGHIKDAADPLKTFIAPKSKIDNLYFTGHGTAMHGVLGVTISAVATCAEILGRTYLLQRINEK